jgi:hypothetical protein
MSLATVTATSVLGGGSQATGLLDRTDLVEALGLDHRGLVHQEIIATGLVGGHSTTLGEHGILEGDRRAGTAALLFAAVPAVGLAMRLAVSLAMRLTMRLAMSLATVTAGHTSTLVGDFTIADPDPQTPRSPERGGGTGQFDRGIQDQKEARDELGR